jgi:16S rRNA processing protein RimM
LTLVELGRVTRPHGVRGELRVQLHWAGSETLDHVREITLMRGKESLGVRRVESARRVDKAVLMRIQGVRDRDAAEALRGLLVCVPRDVLPAAEDGEYYLCDLVGATVRTPLRTVGEVTEVRVHPSVDTLVIRAPDGTEYEQVIAEPWIVNVDPREKLIELSSEEGLI